MRYEEKYRLIRFVGFQRYRIRLKKCCNELETAITKRNVIVGIWKRNVRVGIVMHFDPPKKDGTYACLKIMSTCPYCKKKVETLKR